MLGLSQLHQLRGRVGRGRERAYSYFLYPPEKPMTETAHDRLQTIASHTDLGAGMQVAMKDLEIRGAGNLLGGEQSGHIAGVGFDLYVRLVGEAVAELPRRRRRRRPSRSRSSCRSTRTCRTTTCRGSGCGSRPTRSSPAVADEAAARRHRGRARRPLRRAARAGAQPARGGPAAHRRPGRRRRRHQRAGQPRAVRPGRAAREPGSCGCSGSTPAPSSSPPWVPCSSPSR